MAPFTAPTTTPEALVTPRGLMMTGSLVAAAALFLAGLGAALPGPTIPSCSGRPFAEECRDAARLGGLALKTLALLVGIYGGTLVAIGLGRKATLDDEKAAREDGPR